MNPYKKRIPRALLAVLTVAQCATLHANDWTGGIGFWDDPTNWNGGVPDNTVANVQNGGTAIVTNTPPTVTEAWAGNSGGSGFIIVTNGGTLNINGYLVAGRTGDGGNTPIGRITVENGVINKWGNGLLIGENVNCEGELVIAGTGQVNVTGGWFGVGNGDGRGWLYLRDNAVLNIQGQDFNIGDWGSAKGWCFISDNARVNVSRFWVAKNDTQGALYQTGGAVIGTGANNNEWQIGAGRNAYGFYSLAGGTWTSPFNLHIGADGLGVLYQSGGTNVKGGWSAVGRYQSGYGVAYITGGLLHHDNGGTRFFVAEEGRGELTLAGTAVMETAGNLVLGNGGTANAQFNLNGGTLVVPYVARYNGSGVLTFNGGVLRAKQGSATFLEGLTEARVYAGGAVFDTAGFDVAVNQPLLAPTGDGVVSIPVLDGGSGYMGAPIVSISGSGSGANAVAIMEDDGSGKAWRIREIVVTCAGRDYTSLPAVALLGGGATTPATLGDAVTGAVVSGGVSKLGSGTLVLGGANTFSGPSLVSGGTLQVNVANTLSPSASVRVSQGATLDLNNNAQTVGSIEGAGTVALGSAILTAGGDNRSTVFSGAVTGSGGLIKSGTGTLVLSGPNDYSGSTLVNAGKLTTTTASTGGGEITIADGAALAVDVLAGNGQLNASSVILGGGTTATLDVNLGAFGNPATAPINAGVLSVNGAVTINVSAAALSLGQFPLLKYGTRGGAGTFVLGALPPRMTAALVINEANNSIDLQVIAFDSPKWAGTAPGGVWDIASTLNWVGASSGTPSVYTDGDLVLFDDSALGATTVVLNTTVQPAAVTINNDQKAYTLTGSGKISGSATVTKSGNGTFTLANSGNDYAGATTVNGGVLAASSANALSSGSAVTVDGGTLQVQAAQAAASVTLAGGSISGSGALSASAFDLRQGSVSAKLTGAGAVTKSSPGTVTISGANDYTGATAVNAGTLSAGAANSLSTASTLTVNGGTLDLQASQAAGTVTLVSGNISGSGSTLSATSVELQGGSVTATLGGSAAVRKTGGGTVTLADGNTYTGPTYVSGGTLSVASLGNGGSASSIGASSSDPTNLVLNGGTLRYTGPAIATDRGYTLSGASGIEVQSGLTFGGNATATSGSFRKTGSGTLTYAGAANTVAASGGLAYRISEGKVVFDGTTGQTVTIGDEMAVGDSLEHQAELEIRGSTVNVAQWLAVGRGNGTMGLTSTLTMNGGTLTAARGSLGYSANVPEFNAKPLVNLNGDALLKFNNQVFVGESLGADATININDNATMIVGEWFAIGQDGTGRVNVSGNGRLVVTNQDLNVADVRGAIGFMNVSNNATVVARSLFVGKSELSVGVLNQDGGVIQTENPNNMNDWQIGGSWGTQNANAQGTYNLYSGVLDAGVKNLQIGAFGTGTMNQTGGTASCGGWPSIGRFSSGIGVLNISGGVFNQTDSGRLLQVAEDGNGTLNVSGTGLVNVNGALQIGSNPGSIGTVNLDGGVIRAMRVQRGGGYGTLNFNGGVLKARISTETFLQGLDSVTIKDGGAVVDTDGNTVTIAQDLLHDDTGAAVDGGLTKAGAGTLNLNGAATFTGPIQVLDGTLNVRGTLAGALTVEPSGTLALGSTLEMLDMGGDVTLGGAVAVKVDRDNLVTGCDTIRSGGNITLGGKLSVVNIGSELQLGDMFLFFEAMSYLGEFEVLDLPVLSPGLAWDTSALEYGMLTVQYAPVAVDDSVTVFVNNSILISFTTLLQNDSDPDNDPLTISATATNSVAGGVITLGAGSVTYTPPANSVGSDSFTYTLSDGRGGVAMGTVHVTIARADETYGQSGTVAFAAGKPAVAFSGVPGRSYVIERAATLPGPWQTVATVVADEQGRILFTDLEAPASTAFYRTRHP